jgi:hypothetical protein
MVARSKRFMDPREAAVGHIVVWGNAAHRRQKKALWGVDTAEWNN